MNCGNIMMKSMELIMIRKKKNFTRCHICEAVNYDDKKNPYCRRCKIEIHQPEHISFHKTLAFLITAMILYIPANVYPILISKQFGIVTESTIMGGIIHLWEHGSYPIALIILVASVFVPILKFIFIIYLLLSSKYNVKSSKVDKTQTFLHYRSHRSLVDDRCICRSDTLSTYTLFRCTDLPRCRSNSLCPDGIFYHALCPII